MKLHRLLLALLLAALLAGCVPVDSLNPLYTGKDIVFDKALLGQWGPETEGLNFAKLGDNGYRIVWSGKDDDSGQTITVVYDAYLVNLYGHRFLDVVCRQSNPGSEAASIPEVHVVPTAGGVKIEPRLLSAGAGAYLELLPAQSRDDDQRFAVRLRQAHQFFKVILEDEGSTLKLVQLDDSWIGRQIQEGRLVIDHEIVNGGSPVLTASTSDLQQLVLEHFDDEEAFHGDLVITRLLTKP